MVIVHGQERSLAYLCDSYTYYDVKRKIISIVKQQFYVNAFVYKQQIY